MNDQLSSYVSTNADFNCDWNTVAQLRKQLTALSVVVTSIYAINQNFSSGQPPADYGALIAIGMIPTDRLFYNLQIAGSQSWYTAAEVAADLAPKDINAVRKVMADFFPGVASDMMLLNAIENMPGVNDIIRKVMS